MPSDSSPINNLKGAANFPVGHRLYRLVWSFVWGGVGSWTPVPFFGWRRFLLRLFGARIHPKAKIYPLVKVWYPPNLDMDRYSCLGWGVNCYCMAQIRLDAYAVVSQGASLCAGSHDIDDPYFQLITRPIRIGVRAWVAAEAFVGPGVTIGDSAVLGARAVAMKSLEPMVVYAGNPARPIRARRVQWHLIDDVAPATPIEADFDMAVRTPGFGRASQP